MDKVLIQLYIPVTGKCYDIKLPQTITVLKATELISSFFTDVRGGAFLPDEHTSLCDFETGVIFDINASIQQLHLQNGSKLMLI